MSKLFSSSSPWWPSCSLHCLGSTNRIPLWEAGKAHFPSFTSMWVKPLCMQTPWHWGGSQVIGRRHENHWCLNSINYTSILFIMWIVELIKKDIETRNKSLVSVASGLSNNHEPSHRSPAPLEEELYDSHPSALGPEPVQLRLDEQRGCTLQVGIFQKESLLVLLVFVRALAGNSLF